MTSSATKRHPASAGRTARGASLVMTALCILIAGGVLIAGCSDFAGPAEDDEDDTYPLRTSRTQTIEKLEQAYAAMDSTAFADCLATDFEFWLNPGDLNDPQNPLPSYWGSTEELAIAGNMFEPGTNVLNITLTLTPIGNPVEIPAVNPEDPSSWEHVCGVDLYVYLPGDLILWGNAASRFTVSVDPDDTGPAGETLWEISKWEDIDLQGREESTWGSIKAMYR